MGGKTFLGEENDSAIVQRERESNKTSRVGFMIVC